MKLAPGSIQMVGAVRRVEVWVLLIPHSHCEGLDDGHLVFVRDNPAV